MTSSTAPITTAAQALALPFDALERDVRRAISVARRVAANPFIPARPTAAQLAFLLAEEREALFTGSGGCGKTFGLLMAGLLDVDRPRYRALLVQRTLAGPVTLSELARAWLEGTDATWDSNARVWRFPSGASLDFGHERYLYVAGEYHFVGLDNATLFSDVEYRRLFGVWRRRQGSTTPMRVRVATSPGGPGHDWVRERFAIDNPASVLPLGRRVVFVRMEDNEHLDVEEYRRSLANLDPVRRAQLETGDWSIRQGGAIFQRQWFRIVDRAPAGLRRVRFWDLAATAEPTRTDLLYDPDYTVGALLGPAHDGTVYVLDVIRRRLDSPDVKRLVRQTAELDGRDVVIGMEQESGASGKSVIVSQLSNFVSRNSVSDLHQFLTVVMAGSFSAAATMGPNAPSGAALPLFFLFLAGVLTVVGGILIWLELLARTLVIYAALPFFPVLLAAALWPRLSGMVQALAEVIVAVIVSKFIIVVIVAAGVAALAVTTGSDPPGSASSNPALSLLVGAGLLIVAAWAPWKLYRLMRALEAAMIHQVGHQFQQSWSQARWRAQRATSGVRRAATTRGRTLPIAGQAATRAAAPAAAQTAGAAAAGVATAGLATAAAVGTAGLRFAGNRVSGGVQLAGWQHHPVSPAAGTPRGGPAPAPGFILRPGAGVTRNPRPPAGGGAGG